MHAAFPMLVWLSAGQFPAGARTALTSDQMEEDSQHHLAVARGHVLLRTGTLILHADELFYDVSSNHFEIRTPLFGVDGTTLITASRAAGTLGAGLGSEALTLNDVRIEEFQWLPPDIGLRAQSAAEVRRAGHLIMAVEGKLLKQLGPEHYELDQVRVSPCACPEAGKCRPDWALAASRADIHSGSYALLDAPVLRLSDFPVPLLRPPLLYVPLSHRRSGFLLPHLYWQAQNGFLIDEPFYLVLGESADLTLTAGDITGATEHLGTVTPPGQTAAVPGGTITGSGAGGVRGPRASAEFRYAPAEGTTGRVLATAIDDLNHDLDATGVARQRGFRGILHALQVQDLGPRDGDRFDLDLVSDARLTGQLTTDLLFAQIPATRSSAFAFHRSDDWLFTLDGVYLQDFQGDFAASNTHGLLFGHGAPSTIARLPALTADLAEVPIGRSPVQFAFTGSLLRDGPLAAYDSLALAPPLSVFNPNPAALLPAYTLAPGEAIQQARVAMERLDLDPTVSLPWAFGRFATASLSASWRHDVWLFENNPLPADLSGAGQSFSQAGTRGYPVLDLELGSELSRTFGSGDSQVRHSIAPQLDLRAIPFQLMDGTVPPLWVVPVNGRVYDHSTTLPVAGFLPLPYDEIDTAAGLTSPSRTAPGSLSASTTPGGIAQGVLHVDQRIRTHAGEVFGLDVGEDFDGAGGEATYATASARAGAFHAAGFVDWSNRELPCPGCSQADRSLRRLTEAWAETGLNDRRGDGIALSFVRAIAAGAPRIGAPLDLLFAPPLTSNDPRWQLPDISQASASATARIVGGLGMHAGASYQLPASLFSQVTVGAGYTSGQRCCTLDLNAVFQPVRAGPNLGFAAVFVLLDLGDFTGSTSH